MKTRNIQHTVLLCATPGEDYAAQMNAEQRSKFAGARARIRAKAGAAFCCYDGYITGLTLELKPGNRIVPAWRSQGWPDGHYSIVTFALAKKSGGSPQLRFIHVGVPANDNAKKNQGWRTHYWQPLKRFLDE